MKITCCDICGNTIAPEDIESAPVCIPTNGGDTPSLTYVKGYRDVCPACRHALADSLDEIIFAGMAYNSAVPNVPAPTVQVWRRPADAPKKEGRYLVADMRFGKPHVGIAIYDTDTAEWVTAASTHPEDILYWTDIPETPEDMTEPEDQEEDDDGGMA